MAALVAVSAVALGCSSSDAHEEPEMDQPDPQANLPAEPGIIVGDESVQFQTEEFTLAPGAERFLCYAATTGEDLAISGYDQVGRPVLHHVVFSRATEPEPEGFSECDTLFRLSWEPLFITGAGDSGIHFPEGAGHALEAGTQLVAQLHLLNASTESVTDSVRIDMARSPVAELRPIGNYVFGNFQIDLPPVAPSTIQGTCEMKEPVELIAGFPHMHLMGRALKFEVGPSEAALAEVYRRDPYDFDDQRLELVNLNLRAGDVTRVTCDYENTLDQSIGFGESTTNEMCFFVGFATDRERISGCFEGLGGGSVRLSPE
jgi:hypothetical protein